MAMCKHDLEGGCADCTAAPPAAMPRLGHPPGFGPWFGAKFDSDCDGCGGDIIAGDQIRADGEGGWLCETCGHEEPAVQLSLVPEYQVPVRPDGPSLAAFLDQYREGP